MQRNNSIKLQLEQILRDAKILCELEPFVKKWSFAEMLPHFEITNSISEDKNLTLAEILRDVKLETFSENNDGDVREHLLRKLKEIMIDSAGNDADPSHSITFRKSMDNTLLENQYDHELEKTLKDLERVEDVDAAAVTQTDIDDFIRGLGGKPDGLDLEETNIREWKNIFMERWLDLNQLDSLKEKPNKIKQRETLPNIIRRKSPIKKYRHEDVVHSQKSADHVSVCKSSRVNLDGHFMTRKERKNMATSSKLHVAQGESAKNGLHPTSSPYYLFAEYHGGEVPAEKRKSLLTLQKEKEHDETSLPHIEKKTANSALLRTSPPRYKKLSINDFQASGDNFHGDRERQTKKMVQNNSVNEVKFKAEAAKKKKNTVTASTVRPSSAIPSYSPISVTGGSSKFSIGKGKIR